MALRVWLPLNGTLENKGISNVTVTNNNVTIDNNGKIGKCYYFNGSSYCYENTYDWSNFNTSAFSLCCWYKEPSPVASGNSQIICIGTSSGWNNIRIGLLRRTSNGYPMFSVSNGSSAIRYSFTATNFSLDVWNHIAVTYNNGAMSMYINGVLDKTMNTTIVPVLNSSQHLGIGSASNGAEKLSGYLNDVRIYDHALSAKEVKEISQGLVLHYKLSNSSITNFSETGNLIPNYKEMGLGTANVTTGTWRTAGANNMTRTRVQIADSPVGECYCFQNSGIQTANDGSCYGIDNTTYFEPNTEYRISMFARITAGTEGYAGYNIYNISSELGGSHTKIDKNYRVTPLSADGSWTYCWYHFKTNSTATRNIYIGITTGETSVTTQMCLVRIEKWNEGMNSSIIIDSSGYGNDGIAVGSLQASQDSERYGISTAFAASSAINCGRNAMVTDSITVSLWAKYSTFSNLMSCTESGGWNFENNSGLSFPVYVNSVGYVHIDAASRPPVANYANAWHMFTGVYDRLNQLVKLYIDGELIGTGAVSAPNPIRYHGTNCIWVNAEAAGSNTTASYGNAKLISDVRIYATALSAEDILDLYHTPASIDNLGGMHGFELEDKKQNILFPACHALITKDWNASILLRSFTQPNCQVTLTDDGLRIYRPANYNPTDNGNTMWGGMRLANTSNGGKHIYNNNDNPMGLQKGHTYIIIFHVKGKTSNAISNFGWTNQMGWGGGGLGPNPSNIEYDLIPANFNGEKTCWYKWTINDDIVKTCTTSYSYAIQGNQYMSYADFAFGWVYQDTGSMGSDIYITDIQMYDITDDLKQSVLKNGIVQATAFWQENTNNISHFLKGGLINTNNIIEK